MSWQEVLKAKSASQKKLERARKTMKRKHSHRNLEVQIIKQAQVKETRASYSSRNLKIHLSK